jgi:bifunctional non-homologous end joining protein LigD
MRKTNLDRLLARRPDGIFISSSHSMSQGEVGPDLRRLKPLIRKTQPYMKRTARKGIWVEPELLAEIEYRAKSAEGKVRHPFCKGLREDI